MAVPQHVDAYDVRRDAGTGGITCSVTSPALDVEGAWSGPELAGAVLYRNVATSQTSPVAEFGLAVIFNGPRSEELAFYQDGSIRCYGKGLTKGKGAGLGKGPGPGPGPGPGSPPDGNGDGGCGSSDGVGQGKGAAFVAKGSAAVAP